MRYKMRKGRYLGPSFSSPWLSSGLAVARKCLLWDPSRLSLSLPRSSRLLLRTATHVTRTSSVRALRQPSFGSAGDSHSVLFADSLLGSELVWCCLLRRRQLAAAPLLLLQRRLCRCLPHCLRPHLPEHRWCPGPQPRQHLQLHVSRVSVPYASVRTD